MPRILNPRKSFLTQSGEDLPLALRSSQYGMANQQLVPSTGGTFQNALPVGQGEGDQTTRVLQDGSFEYTVYDRHGNRITATLPADISNSLSFKTGTAAPTIADYPNDGDNGDFYDAAASQLYIVRNYGGTLIYPNFVSISGTISDTQHGDRSTANTTMHKFAQISGTITDTQHGSRGGGNLHDAATGAANGFMSSTDKTKLDNAVSTATASRLVIRDGTAGAAFGGTLTAVAIDASGNVNTATFYQVDGVQVVKEQQAAIAGADGTLADATTKINLVIGTLRQHGLIAT